MNKPLVVTLLTSAILALAVPATGAPPHVSVTGGGTIVNDDADNGTTAHVTISARRPADAPITAASGNVTIKRPGEPAVHGTVSCLRVSGESAGLSGQLDNGLFFYITVTDGEQAGVPDQARLIDISDAFSSCRERHAEDIINGNFQVRGLNNL